MDGVDASELSDIIYGLDGGDSYWGQNNAEPMIGIWGLHVNGMQISILGANKDTIKVLADGVAYMKFKSKELAAELDMKYCGKNISLTITLVGKPNVNTYYGRTTPQIFVEDWEINEVNNIMEGF